MPQLHTSWHQAPRLLHQAGSTADWDHLCGSSSAAAAAGQGVQGVHHVVAGIESVQDRHRIRGLHLDESGSPCCVRQGWVAAAGDSSDKLECQ